MKKSYSLFLTLLIVFGFVAPAFADSSPASGFFDPIDDRILTDPLFMPLKGQVYGTTTYNYEKYLYKTYNHLGSEIKNSKGSVDQFNQAFDYGITNNWSLAVSETYDKAKTDNVSPSSGDIAAGKSHGFTDPTVSTTFRAIDQATAPVDVNLTGSITPDFIDYRGAGNTRQGTEGAGGQPVSLNLTVGREMKNFTIDAFASSTYFGNIRFKSYGTNDNYIFKERFNDSFGINTQTRITDRFSVNLGGGYTIEDSFQEHNLVTGSRVEVRQPNVYDGTIAINYHFIPNRLVGSLTYEYELASNDKYLYANPNSDVTSRHETVKVFGARLSYLFF